MLTIRGRLITPFVLGSMSVGLNFLIRHSFMDLWVWITALVPWPQLLKGNNFVPIGSKMFPSRVTSKEANCSMSVISLEVVLTLSTLSLWNEFFHNWIWTRLYLQKKMSIKNQNRMANSVDPDANAHYEPSVQDLHCLQKYIYYSKFAKDHFFEVRYFVHIITIYYLIATEGKSMFGPHKRVMQLLIWHVHFAREAWEEAYPWKSLIYGQLPSCTCVPETRFCLCYRQILIEFNVRYGRPTN